MVDPKGCVISNWEHETREIAPVAVYDDRLSVEDSLGLIQAVPVSW